MPDAPYSHNIGDPIERIPVADRTSASGASSTMPEARWLSEDLVSEVKRLREELHALREAQQNG